MTDIQPDKHTIVTLCFEGFDHKAAADDFVIQFADGGLDQHLEGMFGLIGRNLDLDTSDFSTETRTITLKFVSK